MRTALNFGAYDESRMPVLAAKLERHLGDIARELEKRMPVITISCAIDWMDSGLRGPWDETLFADRTQRALLARDRGIPRETIIAAVHVVRAAYLGVAPEHTETILRLLDLDLALMLHAYEHATEERLMERERRWQTDQRTAMQTLSTGFAHELRNPLNSARLQLDVLQRRVRRGVSADEVAETAARARHELDRLCDLVEDFLAYAQPTALLPVLCDLVAIVELVVEVEQSFAKEHGIELKFDRPPSHVQARVDPEKVRQLLANLVRNGIEASPLGGHVSVRVQDDVDHVHIHVVDNGPGITDAVRARMFEPFFSTKDMGTGLGMSIVQSIVALHGGKIDVHSSTHGTELDVSLPRA